MRKYKEKFLIIGTFLLIILYLGMLIYISRQQNPYRVELKAAEREIEVQVDQKSIELPVELSNYSNRFISTSTGFFLDYHLENDNNELLSYDNQRSEIKGVLSTDTADIPLLINIPDKAGVYYLYVDIVEEGIAWFSDKGNDMLKIKMVVTEG